MMLAEHWKRRRGAIIVQAVLWVAAMGLLTAGCWWSSGTVQSVDEQRSDELRDAIEFIRLYEHLVVHPDSVEIRTIPAHRWELMKYELPRPEVLQDCHTGSRPRPDVTLYTQCDLDRVSDPDRPCLSGVSEVRRFWIPPYRRPKDLMGYAGYLEASAFLSAEFWSMMEGTLSGEELSLPTPLVELVQNEFRSLRAGYRTNAVQRAKLYISYDYFERGFRYQVAEDERLRALWMYVSTRPDGDTIFVSPRLVRAIYLLSWVNGGGRSLWQWARKLSGSEAQPGDTSQEFHTREFTAADLATFVQSVERVRQDFRSSIGFWLAHELGHIAAGNDISEWTADRNALPVSRDRYGEVNLSSFGCFLDVICEHDLATSRTYWSVGPGALSPTGREEVCERLSWLRENA